MVGTNYASGAARFHFIHYVILTAVSFNLVLKWRKFNEAVQDINLVDFNIDAHLNQATCSTRSKIVIAFLLSCTWVG